jgi:hypothetical protein
MRERLCDSIERRGMDGVGVGTIDEAMSLGSSTELHIRAEIVYRRRRSYGI